MYRIKVLVDKSNVVWYKYGFSRKIMKMIHLLFNLIDSDGYHIYEILEISELTFSFSNFKKCLQHKILF